MPNFNKSDTYGRRRGDVLPLFGESEQEDFPKTSPVKHPNEPLEVKDGEVGTKVEEQDQYPKWGDRGSPA